MRQYSAQQKEIKKTEEFIRKNIAGRKSKMARGRRKQLERMEKMEALDHGICPTSVFNNVDFPTPLKPVITTFCPPFITKSILDKTG